VVFDRLKRRPDPRNSSTAQAMIEPIAVVGLLYDLRVKFRETFAPSPRLSSLGLCFVFIFRFDFLLWIRSFAQDLFLTRPKVKAKGPEGRPFSQDWRPEAYSDGRLGPQFRRDQWTSA
jgi:hypothetical protein